MPHLWHLKYTHTQTSTETVYDWNRGRISTIFLFLDVDTADYSILFRVCVLCLCACCSTFFEEVEVSATYPPPPKQPHRENRKRTVSKQFFGSKNFPSMNALKLRQAGDYFFPLSSIVSLPHHVSAFVWKIQSVQLNI